MRYYNYQKQQRVRISVPFRGLFYLNRKSLDIEQIENSHFRPLPGTLLSKWYMMKYYRLVQQYFRPLPGTLLSKLILIIVDSMNFISVPFRGLFYLNKSFAKLEEDDFIKISVPFRGLFYLNTMSQYSLLGQIFLPVCVANEIGRASCRERV